LGDPVAEGKSLPWLVFTIALGCTPLAAQATADPDLLSQISRIKAVGEVHRTVEQADRAVGADDPPPPPGMLTDRSLAPVSS